MVIIELTGLPGCGKTTLINSVLNDPKYSGRIITRDGLFSEKVPGTWIRKYFIAFCASVLLCKSYFRSDMNNKKLYFKRLLQLMIYMDYKVRKTKDSIFILDEGIVQYVSSLAYDKEIEFDSGLKKLVRRFIKKYDPTVIDCHISVDTAYDRIMGRGKTNDRYYLDDKDEVKRLLKIKRDNIDMIIKEFIGQVKTVDLMDKSADAAEILKSTLEGAS